MHTQLKHIVWQGSLLALVVTLLAFGFVRAEGEGPAFTSDGVEAQLTSGSLDPTFSGDGARFTHFGGSEVARGVAIQADGKIILVGDKNYDNFALARYNPNGSLDTTFSGDGKQTTNFGGSDVAYGVAIQPDGKIVVSGETQPSVGPNNRDLAVARYNTDGSLDLTFSGDGKQKVDTDGAGYDVNGSLGDPHIQPDGKIVAAGYGYVNGSNDTDFVIYRLNPDGSLDSTFGGSGAVSFGFGAGRWDIARDLILQNGKIIAFGDTCVSSEYYCDFAVARLNLNGTLDATFSGDGKQTTNFGGKEYGYGLAKQSGGKIVAVGSTSGSNGKFFAVARYNQDGTLDTTFNGTGRKRISFSFPAAATDVQVRGDGKIVVVGLAYNGTAFDISMVRLESGGALDTTFSGNAKATYGYGTNDDYRQALAIQEDGKYVLAGAAFGIQSDFAVLRILP
jgi:uncharacterized delta-60 repeat protein